MFINCFQFYPKTYEPVYKIKEKLNVLCSGDYNTIVFSFEKIGANKIIVINDNSFMGFCRDIFLNPSFNYFSYFKCSFKSIF
jgi:hypothetical protein